MPYWITSDMALVVVAAVTVDPGRRLAVLQERKYSSTKWVRVSIRAGLRGRVEEEIAAMIADLAAVNSGVRLEYWSVWGVGVVLVVVEGVAVEERGVMVRWMIGDDDDDDGCLVVKVAWRVLRFGDTNALLVFSREDTRVSTMAIAFRPNFIFTGDLGFFERVDG